MHVTDAGWVFLYVYVYIHDLAIESFIFILIYYSDSLLFSDFLYGIHWIFNGIHWIFDTKKKFHSWHLVPKSELTNYF